MSLPTSVNTHIPQFEFHTTDGCVFHTFVCPSALVASSQVLKSSSVFADFWFSVVDKWLKGGGGVRGRGVLAWNR